jgi:hypothetical protein
MPTPAWDNPADFVDLGDFAVKGVIEFVPQSGARNLDGTTRTVTGIYDGPYQKTRLGNGDFEMDATTPKFTCVEGSCAGARRGDTLVIYNADGKTVFGTFAVMTYPQPDGTGLEVLELSTAD